MIQGAISRGASALLFCLWVSLAAAPQRLGAQESRLVGQLLVAAPENDDPHFAETVIYMIEHDQNGAMGLVINRPIARGPIADLLEGLGAEGKEAHGEIIIHYGGPVEGGKGFVLHSDDYASDKTTVVAGGLAVTTDVEVLRAIGRGEGPKKNIFVFGYAGWAPGQLEAEIKAGAWFSIPADAKLIFEGDPERMWERALARQRVKT